MIYLDNHATTAVDPNVVEAMLPYFTKAYGNPSSNHSFGEEAATAAHHAKEQVAALLGSRAEEIIFTSGATESNNLAILGSCRAYVKKGGTKRRLVTLPIEHKSVLGPMQTLSEEGWDVCLLPVDNKGTVDLNLAAKFITDDTFLVSAQLANSEIGTIQPLKELANISLQAGSLFHTDASQAVGKVEINLAEEDIHFLSFSGHKVHAPKGIGALYIKSGFDTLLSPLLSGGNQENAIRPGTLPVPLVVALGEACAIAKKHGVAEQSRMNKLRNEFEEKLLKNIPQIISNGDLANRLVSNSNLTFPNVDAEALLANLSNVIASTGSACESGSIEPSRVLLQIGHDYDHAFSTIRFGFSRFTTLAEIEQAVDEITRAYYDLLDVA